MRTALLFLCLHLSFAPFSWAQSSMIFKREIITIAPAAATQNTARNGSSDSEAEAETASAPAPAPTRQPVRFYTDMRSEQVIGANWGLALNRISAKHTMTVLFDSPRYDIVQPYPMHSALDILLISPEGTIVQIMPELVLAEMPAAIEAQQPIRARLILKGGAAQALGLTLGDQVQHSAFQPAPTVLR